MKKFLIISPTLDEIEKVKKTFSSKKEIDFLTTKAGIFNATMTFQKFILENYKLYKNATIILMGIGGGFKENNIKLLDICIAKKEFLADFGICFLEKIEYFKNSKSFGNNEIFFNIENFHFPSNEIKIGNFITVNCVTANEKRKEFFLKKFRPICENMEGFCIGYIAQKYNIDFLEIRCISNYIGERNNWKIKQAIEKLNNFIINLVEKTK